MSDMRMPRATPQHRALPSGGGRTVLGLAGPLAAPIRRPRPHLAAQGLEIEGPVPIPGEYPAGTAGFRYWAVAEALERGAALWRAAAEFPWAWAGGGRLRVQLAGGTDAVCERGRLRLGAGAPQATVMRALGHAVLDGLRPALWHVAASEVAGFHTGFADAAAMLAALDVSGIEDGLAQASTPFGRVFAEVLAVLAAARRRPDPRLLALRGARLLADATRRAPVAPDFTAQVAAEMALAAAVQEGPLVALQLRDLFARHGLLARSPVLEAYDPHLAEDGTELPLPAYPLPWVATDAAALGLDLPLLLCPATQPPLMAPAADAPAPVAAAHGFAQRLFASGMVEKPRIGRLQRRAPGTNALATHLLQDDGRTLRLVRERFVAE
jgi:hypothetical protein